MKKAQNDSTEKHSPTGRVSQGEHGKGSFREGEKFSFVRMKKHDQQTERQITELTKYIYKNTNGHFVFKDVYKASGLPENKYDNLYEILVNLEHIVVYRDGGKNEKVVIGDRGKLIYRLRSYTTARRWLNIKYFGDMVHWPLTILLTIITICGYCGKH